MTDSALFNRYAKALFELATKGKILDKAYGDLQALSALYKQSDKFVSFTKSPVISKSEKEKAFAEILKKAKTNKLTVQFISTLVKNGRSDVLPGIIEEFEVLYNQHKNIENVEVISAGKLKKAQMDSIEKSLEKTLGKKIKIENNVDESILGGLIIKWGSKMLDASVSGSLDEIKILTKKTIASI